MDLGTVLIAKLPAIFHLPTIIAVWHGRIPQPNVSTTHTRHAKLKLLPRSGFTMNDSKRGTAQCFIVLFVSATEKTIKASSIVRSILLCEYFAHVCVHNGFHCCIHCSYFVEVELEKYANAKQIDYVTTARSAKKWCVGLGKTSSSTHRVHGPSGAVGVE